MVELLVVIGIIVVLAGLLTVSVTKASGKGQRTKAQAEITTLMNAIKQFEAAYGVLPIPNGLASDGKLSSANYKLMISVLQADDEGLTDADKQILKKMNKRGTKFMDVQGNEAGTFTDPWGEEYIVYFDAKYDGKIEIASDDDRIPGLNVEKKDSKYTYRYSVIILSAGNNRKVNSTPNHANNEDNVYSIPTVWSSEKGHTISK
ncbi:MAG: hypothetical protein J6X49_01700 [Victivallales bacterium]|nr:hypothetical protein [Victivallales bacterium]